MWQQDLENLAHKCVLLKSNLWMGIGIYLIRYKGDLHGTCVAKYSWDIIRCSNRLFCFYIFNVLFHCCVWDILMNTIKCYIKKYYANKCGCFFWGKITIKPIILIKIIIFRLKGKTKKPNVWTIWYIICSENSYLKHNNRPLM